MKETYPICNSCPLGKKKICHPELTPEKFEKSMGKITDKLIPLSGLENFLLCRHYTCNAGREQAHYSLNQINSTQSKNYRVHFINEASKIVCGIEFGTVEEKPAGINGRIVDENGRIFSCQNGEYYVTGQNLNNYG